MNDKSLPYLIGIVTGFLNILFIYNAAIMFINMSTLKH